MRSNPLNSTGNYLSPDITDLMAQGSWDYWSGLQGSDLLNATNEAKEMKKLTPGPLAAVALRRSLQLQTVVKPNIRLSIIGMGFGVYNYTKASSKSYFFQFSI